MKFDTEYIEQLAKIINDNGLSEISLEDGEQAVTIRKDVVLTGGVAPVAVPSMPVSATQPVGNTSEASKPAEPKGKAIVSPMVGTFYKAPSPDAEPFVKIGDSIAEGDVVCIVEAMKMMNEIESEVSGKIVEICVEDGQPVEFGQVLMYVE